jgi:hypothetical protein
MTTPVNKHVDMQSDMQNDMQNDMKVIPHVDRTRTPRLSGVRRRFTRRCSALNVPIVRPGEGQARKEVLR